MISKMETGTGGGIATMKKVAAYYGVSLDWLLHGDKTPAPTRTSLLSDDEGKLIENFRNLSPDVADAFQKSMQAAAKKT